MIERATSVALFICWLKIQQFITQSYNGHEQ